MPNPNEIPDFDPKRNVPYAGVPNLRTCARCGISLEGMHFYRQYCSGKCQKAASRERQKGGERRFGASPSPTIGESLSAPIEFGELSEATLGLAISILTDEPEAKLDCEPMLLVSAPEGYSLSELPSGHWLLAKAKW